MNIDLLTDTWWIFFCCNKRSTGFGASYKSTF